MVHLVKRGHQASKVPKEKEVLQDYLEEKGIGETLVNREPREHLAMKVHVVCQEPLDLWDLLAHQEKKEMWVHKENQE